MVDEAELGGGEYSTVILSFIFSLLGLDEC